MRLAKVLAAAAVLSMASAPALAAPANPASSLSLAKSVRASTPVGKSNGQVESSTTTYVVAFFVVVAIGLGLYVAVDGNDRPDSP